jgi:hypothetical protein
MSLKKMMLVLGITIFLLVLTVNADVPPCISSTNTYYGPMEPGVETTLDYPAGYYDLWFAELPMKFSSPAAANYKNWKWEKIESVQIKNGQVMNVFLGLVGDYVEKYSDWILDYSSISSKSGWGAVHFMSPSGRDSRWAVALCP